MNRASSDTFRSDPSSATAAAGADGGDTCDRLLVASLPWLESWARSWLEAARLGLEDEFDLVQDVCVDALAARSPASPARGPLGLAWLLSIARRRLSDRASLWSERRRGAARQLLAAEAPEIDVARDPIEDLVGRELGERIERALTGLSGAQRRVIEAQWRSDVSTAELARTMGRSENAIRVLRSRGLRELRRRLQAGGDL
ncbi:sigma-70 family RNA polymerase sigma factor [Engelhardtia mirabilis]|uniref:RNA polymerase sigma factor n=1 Tax=Engelhardtia mirabilis TaxID=2528011 RepID=A0A518BFB3_9BACT|nr:RNA polymerase sigma factor [Planctomycetes bacterium Pla133]QDU99996.1 RNA polymerase sigma factor [Planctomycetes bacterium Pla86]